MVADSGELRHGRRVPFERSRRGRVVAGVAAGLGARLGVDPVLVRIALVVLSFAGGVGLVLYGLAWALLPAGDAPTRRQATTQQGVALALIVLGILLILRTGGLWFGDALVWPVVLAAAGSALLWSRSEDLSPWYRRAGSRPASGRVIERAAAGPVSPLRVAGGTLLVAVAVAGFVAAQDALPAARDLLVALLAAVAGVGLLFGPWLWRLVDALTTERRERIRQEERAELAAHLHDSVLQTLALIQRAGDQPRRMVALARRQERELRSWLYSGQVRGAPASSLEAALAAVAEDVEATHDLTVETVVVGDAELDDTTRSLLGALREACVNAAKHAGVTAVDVYVEVDRGEVIAFVRDRGRGFDPDSVPDDRQGIRRSIVERVTRHGGRATITSRPGGGAEVELAVPRRRPATFVPGPEGPQ